MPSATEREDLIAEAVCDLAHRRGDFDPLELLHDLTAHALALLPLQGAGVTIVDERGHVDYVTASDERARELEQIQVDLNEGPCVDSVRGGQLLGPLELGPGRPGALRWPNFSQQVRQAGLISVAAVPLNAPEYTLGALNLMNTQPPLISPMDLRVAGALAGSAAGCFLHRRQLRSQEAVAARLQAALDSRVVIEQAKGVLSERLQISLDEAFARLRSHARSHGQKLSELATEIARGNGPITLNPSR